MKTLLKTKQDKEEFLTWVAWLKADVLPQRRFKLGGFVSGFCCMGVGCIILIPDENLIFMNSFRDELAGGLPCAQLKSPRWLQYIERDMDRKYGYGLSCLNDEKYKTFPEIADILLKVYKKN